MQIEESTDSYILALRTNSLSFHQLKHNLGRHAQSNKHLLQYNTYNLEEMLIGLSVSAKVVLELVETERVRSESQLML
jgi:hypothetical protein